MRIKIQLSLSTVRARVILLSLLGILGICAIVFVSNYLIFKINANIEVGRNSQAVVQGILQLMMTEEKFINSKRKNILSDYEKLGMELEKTVSDFRSLATDDRMKELTRNIIKVEKDHAAVFHLIENNFMIMNKNKEAFNADIQKVLDILNGIVASINDEDVVLMTAGEVIEPFKLELRSEIKDFITLWNGRLLNVQKLFLISENDNYLKTKKNINDEMGVRTKNLKEIFQAVNSSEFNILWEKAQEYLPVINQLEDSLFNDWTKNRKLMAKLEETGIKVQNVALEIAKQSRENIEKNTERVNFTSLMLALAVTAALSVLSVILYRAIMKPVNSVIEGLSKNADQVASTSLQVLSSSRSVAEGSFEQAGASEEMSSFLEKVSSIIRQNMGSAKEADALMRDLKAVIETANNSMSDLNDFMDEISKASDETFKIVKTIDEIAFQTNLLALNAAIEAARAGEAGLGFAVVANEVKNLAMQASDAAKNTSDLIEGITQKIKEGSAMVSGTGEAFVRVTEGSARVAALVGEIAAASDDQAGGIEQVNRAVTEIDRVRQKNAANAKSSASASEDLNAQAGQMKGFVEELVALVGVKKEKKKTGTSHESAKLSGSDCQIRTKMQGGGFGNPP